LLVVVGGCWWLLWLLWLVVVVGGLCMEGWVWWSVCGGCGWSWVVVGGDVVVVGGGGWCVGVGLGSCGDNRVTIAVVQC
jgi:hypothetical protein